MPPFPMKRTPSATLPDAPSTSPFGAAKGTDKKPASLALKGLHKALRHKTGRR